MPKEDHDIYDEQYQKRQEFNPEPTPPTPLQRFKDAIKHVIDGGVMDKGTAEEILAFLDNVKTDQSEYGVLE